MINITDIFKKKAIFLLQALLVTFLWSASRIIIKIGLVNISPYFLVGTIQLAAFVLLILYCFIVRPPLNFKLAKKQVRLLTLTGLVGFTASPLFMTLGLQLVSGAAAGLIAGFSSVLVMLLSLVVLRERPFAMQWIGITVTILGAVVFLSGGCFGGTLPGLILIFLAELGFAFNTVITRLIVRQPGDETIITALVGNGIAAFLLFPAGIMINGWHNLSPLLWLLVLVVGGIFAFAGLVWNDVLEALKAYEVSVVRNTMIIQVAFLSVIFLKERLGWQNALGSVLVILGALLVEQAVLLRKKFQISNVKER